MNLKDMKDGFPIIKEECIVDREFTILGTTVLFLGFALIDETLRVYLLSRDQQEEELEDSLIHRKREKGILTKREEQLASVLRNRNQAEHQAEHNIKSISIANKNFDFSTASSTRVTEYSVEEKCMIFHYIQAGLSFASFEEFEIEELVMTTVILEGEYNKIPFNQSQIDTMMFECRDFYHTIPIKKKLLLTIGEGKPRKYSFISEHNGKKYEFYIENTSFFDPWKDAEERFEDPRYKERFSKEQMEEMKQTILQSLEGSIERGKQYILVEYESEEAILNFYASSYLKEKIENKSTNGSASFSCYLFKSDTPYGKHGLTKKVTCIQYPVDKGIKTIAVEILSAQIGEKIDTILLNDKEKNADVFDES